VLTANPENMHWGGVSAIQKPRAAGFLRTLTPYEDAPCSAVAFDYSGQYLAVGGADARVYGQKQVRSCDAALSHSAQCVTHACGARPCQATCMWLTCRLTTPQHCTALGAAAHGPSGNHGPGQSWAIMGLGNHGQSWAWAIMGNHGPGQSYGSWAAMGLGLFTAIRGPVWRMKAPRCLCSCLARASCGCTCCVFCVCPRPPCHAAQPQACPGCDKMWPRTLI